MRDKVLAGRLQNDIPAGAFFTGRPALLARANLSLEVIAADVAVFWEIDFSKKSFKNITI